MEKRISFFIFSFPLSSLFFFSCFPSFLASLSFHPSLLSSLPPPSMSHLPASHSMNTFFLSFSTYLSEQSGRSEGKKAWSIVTLSSKTRLTTYKGSHSDSNRAPRREKRNVSLLMQLPTNKSHTGQQKLYRKHS